MITTQETKRRSSSVSHQAPPMGGSQHHHTLLDSPFAEDIPGGRGLGGSSSAKHHAGSRTGRIFLSTKPLSPIQSFTNLQLMVEATPRSASGFPLASRFREALPPVNPKLLGLFLLWYFCSAISNNSTKVILKHFTHPLTLTEAQFLINALLCLVILAACATSPTLAAAFPVGTLPPALGGKSKRLKALLWEFATPTQRIISTTLPMGMFQFVGHISSHQATSIIPVSLVHTIKSLSPLTTVMIYRCLFKQRYKRITYLTLIPLVCGVMMTCKKATKGAVEDGFYRGMGYAFISMLIFVSQNIYAKNILTVRQKDALGGAASPIGKADRYTDNSNKKLDKLTILFFCSVLGFSLTFPFYFYSETVSNPLLSLKALSPFVGGLMVCNGMAHFSQSLLAFHLLGLVTPVNYSVANICKRIVVIIVAVLLEGKRVGLFQGSGLVLTMVGLYCYDRWGCDKV